MAVILQPGRKECHVELMARKAACLRTLGNTAFNLHRSLRKQKMRLKTGTDPEAKN